MKKNFLGNESGGSAIEYGLVAALVAVVIIGVVTALGTGAQSSVEEQAEAVQEAE